MERLETFKTVDEIQKANMLIHGHSVYSKPIVLSEALVSFATCLANIDFFSPELKLKPLSRQRMWRNSKDYLESRLRVRDVYHYGIMEAARFYLQGNLNVEELLHYYNTHGKYLNPFSLIVKYTKEYQFYGLLALQDFFIARETFLRQMKIAFKHIELSRKINSITSSCYLHEIMHTQLSTAKGCVVDYNNGEVLCMFLEFAYAHDAVTEGVLRTIEVDKINYFYVLFCELFKYYYENDGTITEFDALVTSKYVLSTLKALRLFQIYYNGSGDIKKEVFQFMQEVIDEKRTLESMLEFYDITDESCTDMSLIKHLTRK